MGGEAICCRAVKSTESPTPTQTMETLYGGALSWVATSTGLGPTLAFPSVMRTITLGVCGRPLVLKTVHASISPSPMSVSPSSCRIPTMTASSVARLPVRYVSSSTVEANCTIPTSVPDEDTFSFPDTLPRNAISSSQSPGVMEPEPSTTNTRSITHPAAIPASSANRNPLIRQQSHSDTHLLRKIVSRARWPRCCQRTLWSWWRACSSLRQWWLCRLAVANGARGSCREHRCFTFSTVKSWAFRHLTCQAMSMRRR